MKTWERPRVELEQYPTPPSIAAHMLLAADAEGDVEDALVVDLGCGGGVLAIAAALMGASHVTAVDIDPAALKVAAQNVLEAEVPVDLIACDVLELAMRCAHPKSATSDQAARAVSETSFESTHGAIGDGAVDAVGAVP